MIEIRIAYHGLGMAGKTTNLEKLKEIYKDTVHDRMHQHTEEGRTVYIDYLAIKLKTKTNHSDVLISLFTTPGQKRFTFLRPWILGYSSSVVFVFDSSRSIEENLESFQDIKDFAQAKKVIVQANKRDFTNPVPLEEIQQTFNGLPVIPASAAKAEGVIETFKEAIKLALSHERQGVRPC